MNLAPPPALVLDRSVSAESFRVYALIATFPPDQDGWRSVHHKTLAAALGITERNIQKHTVKLRAAGWLSKTGDGGCNRAARYLLHKVKTTSPDDVVSDQNHVARRRGQVVDTTASLTTGEVRGKAPRARKTAPLTAGTAPGRKEFLRLHCGFIPPCGWEPIIVKARQARLEAGKGPLPISETFLIEKFLQHKVGKELTLDVIESDFIEWYVREKPPRKTGGTPRPATPAVPPVTVQVSHPTAVPPPEGWINDIMAKLAGEKSLKNLGNARPIPQASPAPHQDPQRRARLRERAVAAGALPEHCRL